MRSVGCVCGEVLAAACHLQGICLFLFGGKVAKLSLNMRLAKNTNKTNTKNLNKTMLTVSMLVPGYPSQV
jgi:hypothetical protein